MPVGEGMCTWWMIRGKAFWRACGVDDGVMVMFVFTVLRLYGGLYIRGLRAGAVSGDIGKMQQTDKTTTVYERGVILRRDGDGYVEWCMDGSDGEMKGIVEQNRGKGNDEPKLEA